MNKTIRSYILTIALYDLIFAYPIYNAYFKLQGLGIDKISFLLSFWALSAMIFEIPSGALADRWNHRKMMIVAPLIKALTFVIWLFADGNIWLYGLGFVFWALASTFRSGTVEAYLYNTLSLHDSKNMYEKILGKTKLYKQIAIGVSMISGGFFAYYKMEVVFYLSIIPLLLAAYFALKLPDTRCPENGDVHYFQHIKNAYKAFRHNPSLRVILMISLFVSLFMDLEEFDQLFFQYLGIPIWTFGLVAFIISMLSSYAMAQAHKLKGKKYALYLLPSLSIILLLAIIYLPPIGAVIALVLVYITAAPLSVLLEGKIQHTIDNTSRATVTSLQGLLVNFLGVVITPIFGIISQRYNLKALYVLMIVFMILQLLYTFIRRKQWTS